MFGPNHYVPILKGKKGEFDALKYLYPPVKSKLTPVIDIPGIKIVDETDLPEKSLEEHLISKVNYIYESWGTYSVIFVDPYGLSLDMRTKNGNHFIDFLFSEIREHEIQAIPVAGLDRIDDENYFESIQDTVVTDKLGLCIRLEAEDVETHENTFKTIQQLIHSIGFTKNNVHLLVDLRNITIGRIQYFVDITKEFLGALPDPMGWRSIILSASGFPENLAGVSPNTIDNIPRAELAFRQRLLSRIKDRERVPLFSDYGICHPDLLDFDPRKYTTSAAIRYTTDQSWLIVKGGSTKKYGFKQFHELSNNLIRMNDFYGYDYSWGDNYISQCADRICGPGNLTTWRKVGTSHHITLVCNQIANSLYL